MTHSSKVKIERYVSKELFTQNIFPSLWKSEKKHEVIGAFVSEIDVNELVISKIWAYIIYTVWKKPEDIFNKSETHVLKKVLVHDGAISRTDLILSDDLTVYQYNKAIQYLTEKKILEVFELNTHEKIVVIHPTFMRKVNGTDPQPKRYFANRP